MHFPLETDFVFGHQVEVRWGNSGEGGGYGGGPTRPDLVCTDLVQESMDAQEVWMHARTKVTLVQISIHTCRKGVRADFEIHIQPIVRSEYIPVDDQNESC